LNRPSDSIESNPTDPRAERDGAVLRTLLLSDLVGSTRLVEELGDARAFELFRNHDRLARDLMERHGGREIDKTDGFLVLFERPIHAVEYALDYHRALARLSASSGTELRARVGIHLGEVYLRENASDDVARGAKPLEVEGFAKPMAARLMALAEGGQTLLSHGAFDLARRAEAGSGIEPVEWLDHGRYRFHGVAQHVRVFEVGRAGAPLRPPRASGKARPVSTSPLATIFRSVPVRMAAAAVVVLLAAGSIALYLLRAPAASGFSFEARDWIVLGEFKNGTPDPVLDEALDLAFRAGLEQSRFANVIPPSRVRTTLDLMTRNPESPLDRTLGSEVCLREGATALVLGRISELGRKFLLSAEIVDPTTEQTIHAVTSQARRREDILDALQTLTGQIRAHLGEALSSIQENSLPLQDVTTPNLEALKAYSLALQKSAQGQERETIALLEQAISLDPEFALAHAKLGTVYFNAGIDPAEGARHWHTALKHSDRLTERERLYIEGSLAWNQRRPEEMARPWYLMSTLYPAHAVGHNNLGLVYWRYQNRFEEARRAFTQSTQAKDPWVFASYHHLGYCLLALGQYDQALESFRTAWEMEPNPVDFGLADGLLELGRYDDGMAFLRQNRNRPSPAQAAKQRSETASYLIDQGRLADALDPLDEAIDIAIRSSLQPAEIRNRAGRVFVQSVLGRRAGAARELTELIDELIRDLPESPEDASFESVPKLAFLGKAAVRLGMIRQARRILDRVGPFADGSGIRFWEGYRQILEGELALSRGAADEAVVHLQAATKTDLFEAHDSLAHALAAAGHPRRAAQEYRWVLNHRGQALAESIGTSFFGREAHLTAWALAHVELARIEHSLGETQEAERLYRSILQQWRAGDDLPAVRDARSALAALEAEGDDPQASSADNGPGRSTRPGSSGPGAPQANAPTTPSRHPSMPSSSLTSASLIAAVKQRPSSISAHNR
jgi:putative peptide modification system cyclase